MGNTVFGSFYGKLLIITDFFVSQSRTNTYCIEALLTSFLCVQFEATLLDQEKLTEKVNLIQGLLLDKMPSARLAKASKMHIIFKSGTRTGVNLSEQQSQMR